MAGGTNDPNDEQPRKKRLLRDETMDEPTLRSFFDLPEPASAPRAAE